MLAPTPASPESVGMSKAAFERIEAHLRHRYVEAGRFPGTQLLVYRRGKVVHSAVQGFADVERKAPMKDDTIFRIYSMTKPITSVAFMMLFEEGRVALDDPVHKYIPEWSNLGVFQAGTAPAFLTRPPSRPMLIVDLLRHTSGLTYGFQQRSNVDAAYREKKIGEVEKAGTLQSMIEDLAKIPLEFSPGDAWNYSVATDVIGYLVGKISGMPFEQFLKQRIFDPLGDERHRLFRAGRQGPPVRRLLLGRPARRHDLSRHRSKGRHDAAGRPDHEFVPRPADLSRAAAACAPPPPTISPSAARCSMAANSAVSG